MSQFLEKHVMKVVFDTAATDTSDAANTTVAAHPVGAYIPNNAVITNAVIDVITTFTSAADTATIAVKVQAADDIVAAIAINDGTNVWDAGLHGTLMGNWALDGNSLTAVAMAAGRTGAMLKTTAMREVTFTVAVQALTAGKLNLYLEYYVTE